MSSGIGPCRDLAMAQVLRLQTQFRDGVQDADELSIHHDADYGFEDSMLNSSRTLSVIPCSKTLLQVMPLCATGR